MAVPLVILFDGYCNLCNTAVQFVIKRDPSALFKFASLQSKAGLEFKERFGITQTAPDSFILIKDQKAYFRSTAALMVVKALNGPIKFLYGFIIVPPFIRNGLYDLISANRYKWFGKKDHCMVPTPELNERFKL